MAYTFDLPARWRNQGWKAKVRGWERVEPPHVTVMFRTTAWRFGLRELDFLDDSPDVSAVPRDVVAHLRRCAVRCEIARAWDADRVSDAVYPHNPVPVYDDCNDPDCV